MKEVETPGTQDPFLKYPRSSKKWLIMHDVSSVISHVDEIRACLFKMISETFVTVISTGS